MATFTKGQQIFLDKSFTISIGSFDTSDVAIISNFTGQFVTLSTAKKSKRLRKVKRKFKTFINNDQDFCFQHMPDHITADLIDTLKKG